MPSSASLARSTIVLHCFSLFAALLILILSVRDCGILSLCLNPLFALLTIGYHVTMLLLAYRRPEDALLPVGYTIAAYWLSVAWLGAYIAMSVVLSSKEKDIPVFNVNIMIPQTMKITQRAQMMLDPLECVILADIAIKSTIQRLREFKVSKGKERAWDTEGRRNSSGSEIYSASSETQTPRTCQCAPDNA